MYEAQLYKKNKLAIIIVAESIEKLGDYAVKYIKKGLADSIGEVYEIFN